MPNYRELTIKEILYDFAVVRGDIKEPYAREALVGIIEDKITKARADERAKIASSDEQNKLLNLIFDLTDPGDCWFDHNDACQAHGWFEQNGEECPHARAKSEIAERAS